MARMVRAASVARYASSRGPGLRASDLTDPTTALHQRHRSSTALTTPTPRLKVLPCRYHDGTLQYTMENMEWVEQKGAWLCWVFCIPFVAAAPVAPGFSKDDHLSDEQKGLLRIQARARLARWPRLLDEAQWAPCVALCRTVTLGSFRLACLPYRTCSG